MFCTSNSIFYRVRKSKRNGANNSKRDKTNTVCAQKSFMSGICFLYLCIYKKRANGVAEGKRFLCIEKAIKKNVFSD